MIKKLIAICLSLTLLLCSSVFSVSFAASTAQTEYILKNIMIDGQDIVNYKLKNPIVAYNGYIYVPMDQKMGDLLGVSATLDSGGRNLSVTPRSKSTVDFRQEKVQNDLDNLTMTVRSDVSVTVSTNGVKPNLTNSPVLLYDSVYYVPVNALVDCGALGWSLTWSGYTGAFISTNPSVPSYAYYDDGKANHQAGLIAYILKKNPKVGAVQAEKIVLYCKLYGEMYGGLDTELLMSICQTESTFDEKVRSTRYYGLMQVMDTNGANYGYSISQLYQAKYNIHMGCILLDHGMKTFNGNAALAMSGYAYGEGAVKAGRHTLKYYNNWMKIYYNMIAYASAYKA